KHPPDISISISPLPSDPNINGSDLILSPNPSLTALFTPPAPQKRDRGRERKRPRLAQTNLHHATKLVADTKQERKNWKVSHIAPDLRSPG
ncbi:hypothetical protein AKJ16_DCAP06533, partial [Drosera capensis]